MIAERLWGRGDAAAQQDARASWDARRRSKLSATDMALANHKAGQGGGPPASGWRVQGERRVFVARAADGGVTVAEGAEAFRLSMAYGGKKDKKKGRGKKGQEKEN